MSITLIATIVALVLGHLAPSFAAAVRHFGWYRDLIGWCNNRFGEDSFWRGRWGIVLALLPAALVVGLLQSAFDDWMWGVAGLVFGTAVLFLAWGPRDLDRDVDAILDASDAATRRERVAQMVDEAHTRGSGSGLVEAVFRNALRRWFGVLFWFLLVGPVGAIVYPLRVLAAGGPLAREVPAHTREGARTWLALLEWPVAQCMTLALALVGNFDSVLAAWRQANGASLTLDSRFLGAAARASVNSELSEQGDVWVSDEDETESGIAAPAVGMGLPDLPALRDAMSLVWRSLLAWLAVLALFLIAGFVG